MLLNSFVAPTISVKGTIKGANDPGFTIYHILCVSQGPEIALEAARMALAANTIKY